MKEKLEQLLAEGKQRIASVATETELQDIKAALLGKQGSLTELMKELPKLDVSLRPEMGKAVNQVKGQLSALLDERRDELKMKASEVDPDFDISVPGTMPLSGGLHPITQMCYDLNDAFRSMGFEIFEEDDITSELYGFDNLNFPPNHPARESMDTYWLAGHDKGECWDKLCLRPHLTGGSVRYLQTHKAPYRFVYPGKVYRNETTDARHERAFFQYEALVDLTGVHDTAAGSAHQRVHTGGQLRRGEGLCHIVVGTGHQSRHLIHFLGPCGKHNDADGSVGGADTAANLKPIDTGQHNVQQRHSDIAVDLQLFQCLLACFRLHHLVAGTAEIDNDKAADAGLVLQYQYLFHGSPLLVSCSSCLR